MAEQASELVFQTSGLEYAALSWGEVGQPVILALHGWLDNALSFSRLGPLLEGYRVVAVDLSGHGHSAHRSLDSTYHIWDDLPQLVDIVNALGGEQITLLGHSRGASVATLLAAALADRCNKLVLIDGFLPAFGDDKNGAHQLERFVNERRKYLSRSERIFKSIDEFSERREQYGFSRDSAQQLAPRALEIVPEGFRLRSDPRLFATSAVYLNAVQRRQLYEQLTPSVLSIIAKDGLLTQVASAETLLEHMSEYLFDYQSIVIEGSHHLHMEEASVDGVASAVLAFLTTHQQRQDGR